LFLLHLPPPVHGSSVVGKIIRQSEFINNKFNTRYINILLSKKVADSGYFSLSKFTNFIRQLYQTVFQIYKDKPNLCYFALSTTGLAFYKDCLLIFIIKYFRISIVYHLHNKGVSVYSKKYIYNHLYKWVFFDSKVILLSKYLYSDIQNYIPYGKVYICPNGIEDSRLCKFIPSHNHVVNLLFLSNLIESKGLFDLLDACKILKQNNIEFNLTLVGAEGDISKVSLISRIDKLDLSSNIIYVGSKYGKSKDDILLTSDIFIFPTYFETFPLVLLEAMQFSLPIISTFEGGIPDVVEDGITGFLINQRDVKSLASRIEELIVNKNLRINMGKAGRKRYEELFTETIFENRLCEILSQSM